LTPGNFLSCLALLETVSVIFVEKEVFEKRLGFGLVQKPPKAENKKTRAAS